MLFFDVFYSFLTKTILELKTILKINLKNTEMFCLLITKNCQKEWNTKTKHTHFIPCKREIFSFLLET